MSHLHVKTGDTVVVIAGKDKGKQGKITAAMPEKNRVVVEGVNMVKRHTKPTQKNPKGGIISKEAPIHVSNVAIVASDGKATKIGYQEKDGRKVRIARRSGEVIDK